MSSSKSTPTAILVVVSLSGLALAFFFRGLLGLYFVLGLFCVILIFSAQSDDKLLPLILLITFFLRAVLAFVDIYIWRLPSSGADSVSFEHYAWQVANAWMDGHTLPLKGAFRYSGLVGALYFLFGRYPLVGQLFNAFLGTIAVFFSYQGTALLQGKRAARTAAILLAFFPTVALHSSILLREAPIVAGLSISTYALIRWSRGGRWSDVLLALCGLLIAALFHDAVIVGIVGFVPFLVLYSPSLQRWRPNIIRTTVAVVLLIVASIVFLNYMPAKLMPVVDSPDTIVDVLGAKSEYSRGRAAYLEGLHVTGFLDIIWQTPIRLIYFLFSPMPWMVTSPADLLGLLDALLFLLLLIFCAKQYRQTTDEIRPVYFALTLAFLALWIVFGWGTSNYGTAIRHRQKLLVLIVPLTASQLAFGALPRLRLRA